MSEPVDKRRIGEMFSRLAPEYDRFNRWSSLGLDGRWRRRLVRALGPVSRVLDLGAGTGALSAAVLDAPSHPGVVGVDLSREMLAEADRALSPSGRAAWAQASGDQLPFADGTFDAAVSAYVVRNLQRAGVLEAALSETHRVLKPGGRIVFLDLTAPRNPLLRMGHALYMRTAVPAVGRWFFGERWPGAYLQSSIEEMFGAETIGRLYASAGFREFSARPLWGGIVSLFSGVK